jgi:hypothetical protein
MQQEGQAGVFLEQERSEALDCRTTETSAEGATTDTAIEIDALGFQVVGIQGLMIATGTLELDGDELSLIDLTPQPLDHEGRVVCFEPVSLTLADDEIRAIRRLLHGPQEEPQGGSIDDLTAIVEDAPVPIDDVPVFVHGASSF